MKMKIGTLLMCLMLMVPALISTAMTPIEARRLVAAYVGCDQSVIKPVGNNDGYRRIMPSYATYEFTKDDRTYTLVDDWKETIFVRAELSNERLIEPFNEETIWASIPTLPRDQMVKVINLKNETQYFKRFKDGSYDSHVWLSLSYNAEGQISRYGFQDRPIPTKPESSAISKDQAIQLAEAYANRYQYNTNDITMSFGYSSYRSITGPWHMQDGYGNVALVYRVILDITDSADVYERLKSGSTIERTPFIEVWVDAVNKSIVWDQLETILSEAKSGKQVSVYKPNRLSVNLDKKSTPIFGYKSAALNSCMVSLPTLQALAKGHIVTAKADEQTFTMNGIELALPAKVLSRKGVLYLPWQSLNSLPGVKAQFDAKLAKLDINTASVTAAK